jgi:hypothetical protein
MKRLMPKINIRGRWIEPIVMAILVLLYMHFSYVLKPLESSYYYIVFLFEFLFMVGLTLVLIKRQTSFKKLLWLAFSIRLLLLLATPNLSPDFYRFIWDGELLIKGINPYAHQPKDLISFPGFYDSVYIRHLYHQMTDLSKIHYSNYPVLNQLFYALPALCSNSILGNIIGLKLIVLLADLGSVYLIKNILQHFKLNAENIWWYILNPFVIIEFSVNLHFEGVMIFFLLGAIYYTIVKQKENSWLVGGSFLAFSAQLKLIPLLFLPFFYKKLRWKKAFGFTAITLIVFILIGQLLWFDTVYISNMLASINDYFVSFEFNASLFAVANHFVSDLYGWNTTYLVGPFLSKIGLLLVVLLAVFRNYKTDIDVIKGMLFGLTIYYIFATTVHPWYIAVLLVLSLFTSYRYALVWSLLTPLTYGIYVFPEKGVYFQYVEYFVVFTILIYELVKYKNSKIIGVNFKLFFS